MREFLAFRVHLVGSYSIDTVYGGARYRIASESLGCKCLVEVIDDN